MFVGEASNSPRTRGTLVKLLRRSLKSVVTVSLSASEPQIVFPLFGYLLGMGEDNIGWGLCSPCAEDKVV